MKEIELTVTVTVEAGKDWNLRAADALRDIGRELYLNPKHNAQKGDGSKYTFEYNTKGVG